MRHVTLGLIAVAGLSLFAKSACAQRGALSYPMAAHVAARYGSHHPGHNTQVIHQVNRRHYGHSYRSHSYHGHRYSHAPVIAHPPVCGHYPAFVPAPVYPYYYRPSYNFGYSTPRYSIRIGF